MLFFLCEDYRVPSKGVLWTGYCVAQWRNSLLRELGLVALLNLVLMGRPERKVLLLQKHDSSSICCQLDMIQAVTRLSVRSHFDLWSCIVKKTNYHEQQPQPWQIIAAAKTIFTNFTKYSTLINFQQFDWLSKSNFDQSEETWRGNRVPAKFMFK